MGGAQDEVSPDGDDGGAGGRGLSWGGEVGGGRGGVFLDTVWGPVWDSGCRFGIAGAGRRVLGYGLMSCGGLGLGFGGLGIGGWGGPRFGAGANGEGSEDAADHFGDG